MNLSERNNISYKSVLENKLPAMNHQIFKIHNEEDFYKITKGIKVAQCMQAKSSSDLDSEKVLNQLEDLVVSDSLTCSYCNTIFEDKTQQRLHYKLDWHRYNLKQHLDGLKSITQINFNLLSGDVSSLSSSEEEDDEDEDDEDDDEEDEGEEVEEDKKVDEKNSNLPDSVIREERSDTKEKSIECVSDSSESEDDEISKQKKIDALLAVANRHSKVFFENDNGDIFSIYRCLLHNKKEIPEVDSKIVAQALDIGKQLPWTVIMIGGGHFAAAVFKDGKPIVHKTFHSYVTRAKQGSSQYSRDSRVGNYTKSAGASLRRYNSSVFIQHVQDILESWSIYINDSSLILFRGVGPYNRSVLFGGKKPALDRNDIRLRALPFPTRRATFNEVKRVYDILSTIEIYGPAVHFTDCFPISPRQPIRKRTSKADFSDMSEKENVQIVNSLIDPQLNDNTNVSPLIVTQERQHRSPRPYIDRAKPRKSPRRPLPDIVARLAKSSSESELDENNLSINIPLYEESLSIDFAENLLAFQDTVPRYMKNKKARRQKRKVKKNSFDDDVQCDLLNNATKKLWKACECGDDELVTLTVQELFDELNRYSLENQDDDSNIPITMDSITKLVNFNNEDGNTMLHLAAIGGYLKIIWSLLEIGSDPCNKNKKLQTPYAASCDKETRNTFRRFMAAHPDKFNYNKSQIPGPLTDDIEHEENEKKRQLKKNKREKGKIRKKEFEIKKQEEETKQRFLNLTDEQKKALTGDQSISRPKSTNLILRCFQCAVDMTGLTPFEYNENRFCSMTCLKEHRLRHKSLV